MLSKNYQNGLILFSKYAFAPNTLQYCGPKEIESVFENITQKKEEISQSSKKLLLQFTGAVPYLELIARANNIRDIFDYRVVEAYWIGNEFLANVPAKDLYSSIADRFKDRATLKKWNEIAPKLILGAKPFHAFHVFDIGKKVGLINLGVVKEALETINNCRIGWGKVIDRNLESSGFSIGNAIVEYYPIVIDSDNKLKIGDKTKRSFYFTDNNIRKGDKVSIHWQFICDKINTREQRNLIYWTNYHLNITNFELMNGTGDAGVISAD